MAEGNWGRSTSAFVIGLGVGAALGVLFAPRAGEETREQISEAVSNCVDDALAQGRKIQRQALNKVDDIKDRFRDAVDAGGRAYRQTVGGRS